MYISLSVLFRENNLLSVDLPKSATFFQAVSASYHFLYRRTFIMTPATTKTNTSPAHGTFRYVTRGVIPAESPYLYHLPPLSDFGDVRSCELHDIRSSLEYGDDSPYKLNKHGFTARRWPSALLSEPYTHSSWNDEKLLKSVYIPEIEGLVLQVTNGKTVFTNQVVMRTATYTEVDKLASSEVGNVKVEAEMLANYPKMIGTKSGGGASPAPKAHNDFAPEGARTYLRKFHPETKKRAAQIIEAEDKLLASGVVTSELKTHYDGPRWAMFSIWRPLKPVKRDPLALSDVSVFPAEDYVAFNILVPSGEGLEDDETKTHKEAAYLAYGSDQHEWHWISNQQPDEVLVLNFFFPPLRLRCTSFDLNLRVHIIVKFKTKST